MTLRVIGAAAALLLLAGCGSDIRTVKSAHGAGSPFTQALTQQYKAYVTAEVDRKDWRDAKYFAKKGLAAAHGDNVQPEQISNWNIPHNRKAEIASARQRLVSALENGARQSKPQEAARAQVRFDCWVQKEEQRNIRHKRPDDNGGLMDISDRDEYQAAPCKSGFFSALRAIEDQ
jgi:OOP family OmpA-OmpF porin